MVKDAFGGDPARQIAAIWAYLKDGDKAGIPDGMLAKAIELKPEDGKPVIYRNFIEGLSPRGIAVGYPSSATWPGMRTAWPSDWSGTASSSTPASTGSVAVGQPAAAG